MEMPTIGSVQLAEIHYNCLMNLGTSLYFSVDRLWESAIGQSLLNAEQAALTRYQATLTGYNCIELSVNSSPLIISEQSNNGGGFGHCVHMRDTHSARLTSSHALTQSSSPASILLADFQASPIASECVDNIILHHVLEFSDDSHQLLREADRTLTKSGHIVIFGFNPLSLWALYRLRIERNGRSANQHPHFIPRRRVLDWLSLLNYDIVHQRTEFLYLPSANTPGRFDNRLCRALLKPVHRWFGMYYVIVAKKRSIAMTPNRAQWRQSLQSNVSLGVGSMNNVTERNHNNESR